MLRKSSRRSRKPERKEVPEGIALVCGGLCIPPSQGCTHTYCTPQNKGVFTLTVRQGAAFLMERRRQNIVLYDKQKTRLLT